MDYKSRHRNPLLWTAKNFEMARTPEPFDVFDVWQLEEIDAPDGSSIFLMKHGYLESSEAAAVTYAIEAAPTDPMRIAFECGDLSWVDFWEHRGWLLRFRIHFNNGPIEAEFITPTQIDPRTACRFSNLGETSPYDLKRQKLERECRSAGNFGRDPVKAQQDYDDFLIRYERVMGRKAAA